MEKATYGYQDWHEAHNRENEGELMEPIKFKAEVAKVQTMADGGVRVVLDLGEDGRRVMEALTKHKQDGHFLAIEAIETE